MVPLMKPTTWTICIAIPSLLHDLSCSGLAINCVVYVFFFHYCSKATGSMQRTTYLNITIIYQREQPKNAYRMTSSFPLLAFFETQASSFFVSERGFPVPAQFLHGDSSQEHFGQGSLVHSIFNVLAHTMPPVSSRTAGDLRRLYHHTAEAKSHFLYPSSFIFVHGFGYTFKWHQIWSMCFVFSLQFSWIWLNHVSRTINGHPFFGGDSRAALRSFYQPIKEKNTMMVRWTRVIYPQTWKAYLEH